MKFLNGQSTVKLINKSDNTNTNELSITIKLPEGDVCKSNPDAKYQITEVITCDPNTEFAIDESSNGFNLNKCQHTIKLKSKYGKNILL